MKSTEILDGGLHSTLHSGYIFEFKTDFVKHEKKDHSLICKGNLLEETSVATKISSHNSDDKTLNCMIEYDQDTTLEIKEEIIQGQEVAAGQKCNEKYETKLHAAHMREANIFDAKKKLRIRKKQEVQESKLEKNYTCEKCARSYKNKWDLNRHKNFECDVMPQFICNVCDKHFKRSTNLRHHIIHVHQKENTQTSQTKFNCNKCSRSYVSLSGLNLHKRVEHAAVKPKFTCDYCSHRSKQKTHLSTHISSKHLIKE
ncbi:zinc finger protein 567-like [Belonocnema kinseyi]|uniref:zinc finger protein 567-like n=1 Tax=Belonocnema kinseyi TaxID=2817044 RepID=UPI00143DCC4A|nr:zinc finger protein 567-like [Belonocnema kinseyi]